MWRIPSRVRTVAVAGAAVAALTVLAAGCGAPTGPAPATTPATPAAPRAITERYAPVINPADFSATIDNPYLPFVPGTRMVFEGSTPDGFEQVVTEVTRDTRKIMGVDTVVVHDTVTLDGKPLEDTFDWYAQHRDGTVWYFGEDTKAFEDDGTVDTAGSFEAGVDGALPGVVMPGSPLVGDIYRQEYAKGIAEDIGEVLSLTGADTVPFGGARSGLVVTEDVNPLEPTAAIENKYYAGGVGLVSVVHVTGKPERIELVRVEQF